MSGLLFYLLATGKLKPLSKPRAIHSNMFIRVTVFLILLVVIAIFVIVLHQS